MEKILIAHLPSNWTGTCTLIQLVRHFTLISLKAEKGIYHHRARRDHQVQGLFDSRIYSDAIGVPSGVPDEFEARNHIGRG